MGVRPGIFHRIHVYIISMAYFFYSILKHPQCTFLLSIQRSDPRPVQLHSLSIFESFAALTLFHSLFSTLGNVMSRIYRVISICKDIPISPYFSFLFLGSFLSFWHSRSNEVLRIFQD